jgi:hypothetical protein
MYRTSQTIPSVAVCFFSFNSFNTKFCMVSDSVGAASWRSRIFLTLPVMSLLTGLKATEPRTSIHYHRQHEEHTIKSSSGKTTRKESWAIGRRAAWERSTYQTA